MSKKSTARLSTEFNVEIKELPDDLKCEQCKSVLKDACQVPCGCRLCRICIDDMISSGNQFCPGGMQECGRTPLSTAAPDYRANNNIMKLIVKCPHAGCTHECPLADMEGHLRVCSNRKIECHIREFPGEDMSSHMQQESGDHSEILIGLVAGIKRDMEMLKREVELRDKQEKLLEKEMKLISDENKLMKENINSINDVNNSIKMAIKSIKDENKSIKIKCDLIGREINNWAAARERSPLRANAEKGSMQVPVVIRPLGDWLIDENMSKTSWYWDDDKTSGKFRGTGFCYTYELVSNNSVQEGKFEIWLRIWAGPSDTQLQWPFRGALTVTVAHRDKPKVYTTGVRQCVVERPQRYPYGNSDPIIFRHDALRGAGLDLERGVRVSYQIVPKS